MGKEIYVSRIEGRQDLFYMGDHHTRESACIETGTEVSFRNKGLDHLSGLSSSCGDNGRDEKQLRLKAKGI